MISIVVPCYNEEKNIHELAARFADIAGKLSEEGFELVLVNNGSSDGTPSVIDTESKNYSFIRKVDVMENRGYGNGILAGLKVCRGAWLGWIHADLQLPPEVFLDFVRVIKACPEGAENIFFKGRRKNRPLSDSFFTVCMGIFETFYLGVPLWDIYAQPTLLPRSFYERMMDPPGDFSLDLYVYYLARKLGMHIRRVPAIQVKRKRGKSSWNTGKLGARIRFIRNTLASSRKIKKGIQGE